MKSNPTTQVAVPPQKSTPKIVGETTAEPEAAPAVELNQFLASAGVGSRRAVDALIKAGHVTVNGAQAEIGARIDPSDDVRVFGRSVELQDERVTIMLNKPVGVVSTMTRPLSVPSRFANAHSP